MKAARSGGAAVAEKSQAAAARGSNCPGENYGVFLTIGKGFENADVRVDPVVDPLLSWFSEFNRESGGPLLYSGLIPAGFGGIGGPVHIQGISCEVGKYGLGPEGETVLGPSGGIVGGENSNFLRGGGEGVETAVEIGDGIEVPVQIQGISGEVRKEGFSHPVGEVVLDWSGEIAGGAHSNFLVSGGEGVETAMELGGLSGGVEALGSKRKLGRPKGSKNKKKIVEGGGGNGGEIIRPKKRGRPKGSKNKKKVDECEGNRDMSIASGNGGGENGIFKPLGRLKGSKNKKKVVDYERSRVTSIEGASGYAGVYDIVKMLERLTVSNNEKEVDIREAHRDVSIEGSNGNGQKVDECEAKRDATIVCVGGNGCGGNGIVKETGRPKGLKNKKKVDECEGNRNVSMECVSGNGVDGNVIVKRLGRPKGSKNKKKIHTCEGNQEMAVEVGSCNAGTRELSSELGGVVEGGDGICGKKAKRRRLKGSKNKMKLVVADNETSILTDKENQTRGDGGVTEKDGVGLENVPHCTQNEEPIIEANTDLSEACKFSDETHGRYESIACDSKSEDPILSHKVHDGYESIACDSKSEDPILSHKVVVGFESVACDSKSEDPILSAQVTENSHENGKGDENGTKKRKRGPPFGYKKKPRLIIAGEVLSYSQKKRRGRPRKNVDEHSKPINPEEEQSAEKGKENSDAKNLRKEQGSLMCHQCLRSDKKDIASRNEEDENIRLQRSLYLLHKTLPLLRHIQEEQNSELNVEAGIRGVQLTEADIEKAILDEDDRVFCDNCNTSIVNFHRSCPYPGCSYDLCLSCCRELRKGFQPGGNQAAESSIHHLLDRSRGQGMDTKVDMSCDFPDWRANMDGRVPCPPKECGGCGAGILALRRIFEPNWLDNLTTSAEDLTMNYRSPGIELSRGCSLCSPIRSAGGDGNDSGVRQASFRVNSHDNFLYCPNAVHLGDSDFVHFQMHWMRGEPVIVRNVLARTSGLSWEPMVMWRAFRSARKKLKEESFCVKAIDCLDWCEVCV
ncbi:transcription factor jumonji (jmjC) domain-containing protein [Actinidia rufa]|uniref:Transcription factor jumonji (JmjC) domain-containing protein n=1 Tax=Actinidia rufa TaxID=165716 RepID=A0A7J0DA72_9ERIC|nr:transcription factor jumonji (jmjC) domain-containing protein [Actinidia rufa]